MVEMLNRLSDAGTGDGGPHPRGSRKTKAFIWLILGVAFIMWTGAKVAAPEAVVNQGMWIVGLGGLFTIGGQSLVDTVAKAVESRLPRKEPENK